MKNVAALAALIPLVAGHGFILNPPARRPGDAYAETCGQQPFSQQSSDINGNVQGIQQVVGDDITAACNLWLCKGFQFEDNTDNVQKFAAGQTIEFDVEIAAPHTGFANVSVVRTGTNSVIGEPLIEFDNYASNAGVDANNTAFSVTIPQSLAGDCTTAGDCVLQWYWDAPDIDQTYESCVDFVLGGSGGGDGPASSSTATPLPSQTVSVPTTSVPSNVPSNVPASTVVTPEPTATTTPPADGNCEEDGDEEDDGEDEDVDAGDDCEDVGGADEGDDAEDGDQADDEDCEEAQLPSDGSGDNDVDDGSGGYEEEFLTSAPGPILITISTDAPAPTSDAPAPTSDAPAPTTDAPAPTSDAPAPTNTPGGGNGGGNNGGDAPQPTTVTVTVTKSAEPTYVTVTAQPEGSVCFAPGDFL